MGQERFVRDPDLARQRRKFLQTVFDSWQAKGEWPRRKDIARILADDFDADEVASALNWPWLDFLNSGDNRVKLRLPGLRECEGAEEALAPFLVALKFAVERYFSKDENPELSLSKLLQETSLSLAQAHQALEWFNQESICSRVQGNEPANYVFELDNGLRLYRKVTSLDNYLKIKYWSRGYPELDMRKVSVEPQDEAEQARRTFVPNTAFIIMPIQPENPEMVAAHRAIKEVFGSFGILAQRADDVQHDGVVTEMILRKIRDAEFLVADLTNERPSVYYEIGYAHALSKRVMMFRRKETRIHFDLAVHNAPTYGDATELKELLRTRLEDRLGRPPSMAQVA
jgi:hypothetical protein